MLEVNFKYKKSAFTIVCSGTPSYPILKMGLEPRREKRESCITCRRMLGMSQSYCIRCQTGCVNKGNLETPTKKSYMKITVRFAVSGKRRSKLCLRRDQTRRKNPDRSDVGKLLPNKCND